MTTTTTDPPALPVVGPREPSPGGTFVRILAQGPGAVRYGDTPGAIGPQWVEPGITLALVHEGTEISVCQRTGTGDLELIEEAVEALIPWMGPLLQHEEAEQARLGILEMEQARKLLTTHALEEWEDYVTWDLGWSRGSEYEMPVQPPWREASALIEHLAKRWGTRADRERSLEWKQDNATQGSSSLPYLRFCADLMRERAEHTRGLALARAAEQLPPDHHGANELPWWFVPETARGHSPQRITDALMADL